MSTVYTVNGKVLKNAANDKWLTKKETPPTPTPIRPAWPRDSYQMFHISDLNTSLNYINNNYPSSVYVMYALDDSNYTQIVASNMTDPNASFNISNLFNSSDISNAAYLGVGFFDSNYNMIVGDFTNYYLTEV